MELEEILNRKFFREQLERSGEVRTLQPISCDDMSESEKESFINFLVSEFRKKDEQIGRLQDANDRQSESLSAMQKTLESIEEKLDASRKTIESSEKTIERLHTQLTTQGNTLKSVESELKKSRREAEKYKSLYEVLKTEKFSQTSQSSKYSRRSSGRDDGKEEWDGSDNDKKQKYRTWPRKRYHQKVSPQILPVRIRMAHQGTSKRKWTVITARDSNTIR